MHTVIGNTTIIGLYHVTGIASWAELPSAFQAVNMLDGFHYIGISFDHHVTRIASWAELPSAFQAVNRQLG